MPNPEVSLDSVMVAKIFAEHKTSLYAFARSRGLSTCKADDAVRETFLSLLKRVKQKADPKAEKLPADSQAEPLESMTTLTRQDLAVRWSCSVETIKRKEKAGYLSPFRIGKRFLRYRLCDIERLEKQRAEPLLKSVG